MKVKISTAQMILMDIYEAKGADHDLADWLTELSLEQDLTGNYFSGLEDGPEGIYGNLDPNLHETYEVDKPAIKLVNGNGKPAKAIMKDIFAKAPAWALTQGQVTIAFKNCGYHGALGTIARKFAEKDLVSVYAANGGPSTVPPYGGSIGLFGTNPLAYGIPTSDIPIVFDAATSERPWGSIGRSRELNLKMPEKVYFDKSGQYTVDPNSAEWIVPFGNHKGYAINLFVDVLTGVLVGAKSGSLVKDENDIGGLLTLIDPEAFGPLATFKKQTDQLVNDIVKNPPAEGFSEVRVPGFRAQQLKTQQLKSGEMEVEERIWHKFTELHNKMVS